MPGLRRWRRPIGSRPAARPFGAISIVAPVSIRAETGRQRYRAHEPSRSAAKPSGCGKPLAIRQLGSTDGTLGPPQGQGLVDRRQTQRQHLLEDRVRARWPEPIGICQNAVPLRRASPLRQRRARSGGGRMATDRVSSPSARTCSSKRSKSMSSIASVSIIKRSARSKNGAD